MKKEELYPLIDEIIPDQPIALSDIPEIDLYVDQVTEFFEKKLSLQKRHSKDKLLTKTMINNYAKAGILMPPRRKRYSRQHIALLLLLYNSKQILSMNDISLLFSILQKPDKQNETEQPGSSLIDFVYELVQEINSDQADQLKEICKEKIELIQGKTAHVDDEKKESIEWFLMAMFLVSQAAVQKRLAETIIDRYFQENISK
jgi:DNA-binding transcriptional MerR regulator